VSVSEGREVREGSMTIVTRPQLFGGSRLDPFKRYRYKCSISLSTQEKEGRVCAVLERRLYVGPSVSLWTQHVDSAICW
jgi:hypothetical protein